MNFSCGSMLYGTRIAVITISAATMFVASPALAQGSEPTRLFDAAVLELLLESRIQRPASQATTEQRASAIDELTNIYLVSNLPRAIELAQAPQLRAQIDLQERVLVFSTFANDFIANNTATEQEIFNLYEEQSLLSPPQEFKARHILVETQSAAVALIEELQSGADFVELAKQRSTGPSAPSGGDLGWFTAEAMVKPFSDAVGLLENGAFTPAPVQTQFGWHVILREESRASPPPPLDSVRDVIAQRIGQQKFRDFLSSLRPDASD